MAYKICATNRKESVVMSSKRLEPMVMLRLRDVLNRTGLSKSTIYNKLDASSPHYDEKFPRQVRLGGGAVRWIESEIDLWLEKCVVSSRGNCAQ